ncbi:hypothetical protein [Isoptericola croceus]|uniref:hypothetical protein n=1 Tax=Isoptericola croceus TaxID=3031406 RepID=UPI0023F8EB96|nr:hypothetical protein [Isoptericola croceus]
MLIAVTAPAHPDLQLLDRVVNRPLRTLVAIGARMTSARARRTVPPATLVGARAAHDHRRTADELQRDNAAQIHPLGLR